MEVVASLSQACTAAAQCGLFTHKSVLVIFEPPCTSFPTCSQKYFEQLQQFVILLNIIFEIRAHFVYWYTVCCVTF